MLACGLIISVEPSVERRSRDAEVLSNPSPGDLEILKVPEDAEALFQGVLRTVGAFGELSLKEAHEGFGRFTLSRSRMISRSLSRPSIRAMAWRARLLRPPPTARPAGPP